MTASNRPLPSVRGNLIALVCALAIATVLGIAASGPNVLPGDESVSDAIQTMDGRVFHGIEDVGELVGRKKLAAAAMSLALIVAVACRAWSETAFLATLTGLRIAAMQIKPIVQSSRPGEGDVETIGSFIGNSYPSEHTVTATTIALGFALIAWRRLPSERLAFVIIGGAVGGSLLAGWARLWVGAHWPSDIVGAYAISIAIIATSLLVTEGLAAAYRAIASWRPATTHTDAVR